MKPNDANQGPRAVRPAIGDLVVVALLFAAALGWFSLTLDSTFNLRDEGYLLYMSARVAGGEIPHRDFVENYGPGVFSATAVPLELGGGQIIAVRWWIAGLKAIAVVLCFLILRRAVSRPFAVGGAAISILYWGRASINLNTPYASLYTIPILMLTLLALLRAAERPTRLRHVLVGAAAGLAILFKQSLGIMCATGTLLAVVSIGALDPLDRSGRDSSTQPVPPASRGEAQLAVGLYALCGLLVLAPTWSFMSLRDYALHLLPIHLLMAVVAASALHFGLQRPITRLLSERALPFALGVLGVLGSVALLYAYWGALPDLVFDMFVFPRGLRNYALPAVIPPVGLAVFGTGLCVIVAAALTWLPGPGRRAGAIALVGLSFVLAAVLLIPRQNAELYRPPVIWQTASIFDWVLPSLLVVGSLALLGVGLMADDKKTRGRETRTLIPIAFFQAFLCFQIFPRAGQNVWLSMGALVPLGVVLAHRIRLWTLRQTAPPARRRLVLALCSLLVIWLLVPVAAGVVAPDEELAAREPVLLPHARGITISSKTAREEKLGQVRALVHYLRRPAHADARLLVLGTEQMLYYASDLQHLVPERDFLIYWAGLEMIPLGGLVVLADGSVGRALDAHPDALVVERASGRPNPVRRAMPGLDRVLRSRFVPVAEFGPYTVLRRSARSESTTPR